LPKSASFTVVNTTLLKRGARIRIASHANFNPRRSVALHAANSKHYTLTTSSDVASGYLQAPPEFITLFTIDCSRLPRQSFRANRPTPASRTATVAEAGVAARHFPCALHSPPHQIEGLFEVLTRSVSARSMEPSCVGLSLWVLRRDANFSSNCQRTVLFNTDCRMGLEVEGSTERRTPRKPPQLAQRACWF
jgi:hypothetical protein